MFETSPYDIEKEKDFLNAVRLAKNIIRDHVEVAVANSSDLSKGRFTSIEYEGLKDVRKELHGFADKWENIFLLAIQGHIQLKPSIEQVFDQDIASLQEQNKFSFAYEVLKRTQQHLKSAPNEIKSSFSEKTLIAAIKNFVNEFQDRGGVFADFAPDSMEAKALAIYTNALKSKSRRKGE